MTPSRVVSAAPTMAICSGPLYIGFFFLNM